MGPGYHDETPVPSAGCQLTYELSGRTGQKRRTRSALVAAARNLVASGLTPTVEQVAAEAGISRAAAYRYFANQRSLLAAAHPEIGATSLLPDDPPTDAAERLAAVMRGFTELILDTEAQQRTMLRLSLAADPAERARTAVAAGEGHRLDRRGPRASARRAARRRIAPTSCSRSAVPRASKLSSG